MTKSAFRQLSAAASLTLAAMFLSGVTVFSQEMPHTSSTRPGVSQESQPGDKAPPPAADVLPNQESEAAAVVDPPAFLPLRRRVATQTLFISPEAASAVTFFRPPVKYRATQTTNAGGGQAGQAFTPLTAEEKVKRGFRSAFLSPTSYAFTAINAAITEATEEDQPQKDTGDRVADGFSRFAISFSTRSIKSILSSGVYPALLKQDPRYHPSGKKGFGPRAVYALSRVFVTRGDNGNSQFNASRIGGTLSASALANLYEQDSPGRDRIGVGPTFRRFGTSLAFDMIQFVVFREFGSDIKKIFKR